MDHVRLECVCRQENSLKFYEMDVAPDMLGSWVLECRWGRIDQDGSVSRNGYPDRDAAIAALTKKCLEKLGRGYRVASDPGGLAPSEAGAAEDWHAAMLRNADELDRLLCALPSRDSRFGRIASSLASACRQRRMISAGGAPPVSQRALWALDDTDHRIRARVFQLLDELLAGVLDDEETAAAVRLIQDSANPSHAGAAVRLIPRGRLGSLDRLVCDAFAGDERLANVADALGRRQIVFVGDLVQAPFEEVLRAARGDRRLVRRVEERLREAGLRLGSAAPAWRRPAVPPSRRSA